VNCACSCVFIWCSLVSYHPPKSYRADATQRQREGQFTHGIAWYTQPLRPLAERELRRAAAVNAFARLVAPATVAAELGGHISERLAALDALIGLVPPAARVTQLRRRFSKRLTALDALGGLVAPAAVRTEIRLCCHQMILQHSAGKTCYDRRYRDPPWRKSRCKGR